MALEIVWRNPAPPAKRERGFELIAVDDFGATYAVRNQEKTAIFELIVGGVARKEQSEISFSQSVDVRGALRGA